MKRLVIEYWVPLVLWLILIFFFSTDAFSADKTSVFIVAILRFLDPRLSAADLQFGHMLVRKLGHMSEYFVLAVFVHRSLKQQEPHLTHALVTVLCLVVVAAGLDEIHQSFTLFRTASPVDVGYDCLGAVSALWLITTHETRHLRTHPIL